MTARTAIREGDGAGAVSGAIWIALALVACLSVLLVNGRPLFYFDTVGYIDQGQLILSKAGLYEMPVETTEATTARSAEPVMRSADDKIADGSRSMFYSVLMGGLAAAGVLEGLVLLHAGAVILGLWLAFTAMSRSAAAPFGVPAMIGIACIAALPTSMPFFVAYLMPDIFVALLVLMIAMVTAYGRDMRWWEYGLAFCLGAVAIVSHLSHLAIAAALVPVVVIVALVLRRGTFWRALVFTLALIAVAFAQQATIRAAASKVSDKEVIIRPFLTARLIQDGPGYDYLSERCPDPAYATCALYEALQRSDDPWRLTASHIIFSHDEKLGSFKFLDADGQIAVARDQVPFFLDVLKDRPLATTLAFVKNTLIQTTMFSVDMTFPSDAILERHAGVEGLLFRPFGDGWLTAGDDAWLGRLTGAQAVWYALALAVSLGIVLRPAGLPPQVRALAVVALMGILANAFVCGAISQPASRYGARMIWLLPVIAAMLVMFRNAGRVR